MTIRVRFGAPSPADLPALVVFSAKDGVLSEAAQQSDTAMGGALRRAMEAARFEGDLGQVVEMLAPAGVAASRLLLVGTGVAGKADAAAFEKIGAVIAQKLQTSGVVDAHVDMQGLNDLAVSLAEAAARLAHGAVLRNWRFDVYRTKLKPKEKPTLEALHILNVPSEAEALYARLDAVAQGVAFTRSLVSEPGNIIYPESFVERCQALAAEGVKIEVLGEKEMRQLGMGALLGVAQGSAREPKLLVMRWDGSDGAQTKPLVLVGKGVTFDSGGISLKPGAGMEDMKWDMGGAGAVAGTMLALAKRKARAHVVGLCGLVENMPDGNAQRPGDVVTSMSGQTIEVINTDAEGRLVLCDVVHYAQETFKPEVVIDLATLTGAIIISLGHEHAGMFTNDDQLARDLVAAGLDVSERLWRFPLGDAYDKMIDSQIADMKNVGPRDAGSITAAQFIQRFVKEGVKWAHLDIAGMVWAAKPGVLHDKGATGYGVRLLDRYVESVCERA